MGLRGIRSRHGTVHLPYAQAVPLLHNRVRQVPASGRIIPRSEAGYLRSCGIALRGLHRAASRDVGLPAPIIGETSRYRSKWKSGLLSETAAYSRQLKRSPSLTERRSSSQGQVYLNIMSCSGLCDFEYRVNLVDSHRRHCSGTQEIPAWL